MTGRVGDTFHDTQFRNNPAFVVVSKDIKTGWLPVYSWGLGHLWNESGVVSWVYGVTLVSIPVDGGSEGCGMNKKHSYSGSREPEHNQVQTCGTRCGLGSGWDPLCGCGKDHFSLLLACRPTVVPDRISLWLVHCSTHGIRWSHTWKASIAFKKSLFWHNVSVASKT